MDDTCRYPQGALWEAKKNGVLYRIVLEEDYVGGMMFCVSITKADGSLLEGRHWENYERLWKIRAAMKFCRNRFYEDLRFRRIQ